jgi:hypothetical protein
VLKRILRDELASQHQGVQGRTASDSSANDQAANGQRGTSP